MILDETKPIKILYLEDDKDIYNIVDNLLKSSNRFVFEVYRSLDIDDALKRLERNYYDVFLLDYYHHNQKTGIDVIKKLYKKDFNKPIIMLTSEDNSNVDIEALKAGASDYLIKEHVLKSSKSGISYIERSIIYSIKNKKLEKQMINEKKIKSMILETTSAGICIVDMDTNKIIEANIAFYKMFDLKNTDNLQYDTLLKINKFEDGIYKNNLEDIDICTLDHKCPCGKKQEEAKVQCANGTTLDCIISCHRVKLKNGKIKTFRIVTFIDITKQKKVENSLIEAQNQLQNIIYQYGIQNQDSNVMMDLVEFEMDKISRTEEIY